jgi:hypothetical protein
LKFLGPFAGLALLRAHFNCKTRRLLRVIALVVQVDIVLGEARTALTPSAGESDPDGIEDRGLAGVVLADENRVLAELQIEKLNRAEVFNS